LCLTTGINSIDLLLVRVIDILPPGRNNPRYCNIQTYLARLSSNSTRQINAIIIIYDVAGASDVVKGINSLLVSA